MTNSIKNYLIKELIHQGNVNTLFRVLKDESTTPFLLKLLKKEMATEKTIHQIQSEFHFLKQLDIPQVIKAIDLESFDANYFLLLEDFESITLAKYIENEDFNLKFALKIAINIAEGIGQIHQKHLIHKDIQPDNILVNSEGNIKIVNFSSATALEKEIPEAYQPTNNNDLPYYISPEQTGRLNTTLDYLSDIYSCGATLFNLFTKNVPFSGTKPMEITYQHVAQKPISPSMINPEVPEVLSEIILKCLSKKPNERYKSAFSLKKDLEKCLSLVTEDDKIPSFEIGQYNVRNKYQAPHQLYGRYSEISQMNDILRELTQGKLCLLEVIGPSGMGKTSLLNELQKGVSARYWRNIYISFDQFKKNIPYYGISNAYKSLVLQIIQEGEDSIEIWKTKILECVGENGQILIDMIPEVQKIIGPQPPVENLDISERENRLKLLFNKFMKLMLSSDRPTVLIFDDYQWGDESTLSQLEYFLQDTTITNFFLVISYDNEEMSQIHPLKLTLNLLQEHGIDIRRIHVSPLNEEAIKGMIDKIFPGLNIEEHVQLAQIIKEKTNGNPLFILFLLRTLYEKNLILFQPTTLSWHIDAQGISLLSIPDRIDEILNHKISKMNDYFIEVMKNCSAIGDEFTLGTVAALIKKDIESTRHILNLGLNEDFLNIETNIDAPPDKQVYYFSHYQIQQLFYSLISDQEKNLLHYKIGKIQLENSPQDLINENVVTITNHLNYGLRLDDEMIDKVELAKYNLIAGKKIKNSQLYHQAISNFKNGIDVLPDDKWETHYKLTMSLYQNYATCMQLVGEIELSEAIFDLCLENAKSDEEKINLHTKILLLMIQTKDYKKVLDHAKSIFDILKYPFNLEPNKFEIALLLMKVKFKLLFNPIEKLKTLPICKDERIKKIQDVLIKIGYPAFANDQQLLWSKIILSSIELFINHGYVPTIPLSLCGYSLLLGNECMREFDKSYEYGLLGYELCKNNPDLATSSFASLIYAYSIMRIKHPLESGIPLLNEISENTMKIGAVSIAAKATIAAESIKLLCGQELVLILESTNQAINRYQKHSCSTENNVLYVYRNLYHCLLGEIYDTSNSLPEELRDEFHESKSFNAERVYLIIYEIWHFILLYILNRHFDAKAKISEILNLYEKYPGLLEWPFVYLISALILTVQLKTISDNPEDIKQINQVNKRLQIWGKASPQNYQIYCILLEGELCRLKDDSERAIQCFSNAIKICKTKQNFLLLGIAYELFARHYIQLGVSDISTHFLQNALYYFRIWGATEKCQEIQSTYSEYFALKETVIKDKTESSWVATVTQNTVGTTLETLTKTMGANPEDLKIDINNIIETSQKFSKEIVFDKLMESLVNLLLTNTGANRAAIILFIDEQPFVAAEGHLNHSFTPIPEPIVLERYKDKLPCTIIEEVIQKKEDIIINDMIQKEDFLNDPYIEIHDPKSIFCMPIVHKGDLKGLLYIENTLEENIFNFRTIRNLSLLSSQIAISIDNARLYTTLEGKVIKRTGELQSKNAELQLALKQIQEVQDQLVQQEKLASLGLLTAGIAHELKNPLNFIINFAQIAKENLLELKQSVENDNIDEQKTLAKEITDNLNIVDIHGHRAAEIIKGMLSHAHQGTKNIELVNTNALVEQGIGLAYFNFRKKYPSFNIEIHKSLDPNLKPIEAFSGDLLRVIINIIDNAFFGISERMVEASLDYSPFFEIKTSLNHDHVEISIRDNGIGISKENINKVFNPFFTTKPAGSGTGLGLSISYDIISKQHGGTITVNSVPSELTEFIIKIPYKTELSREKIYDN